MYTCIKCSRVFINKGGFTQHIKFCKGKRYCQNPKCNILLKNNRSKFCSSRCAAIVNSTGRKHTEQTRKKISISQGGSGKLKNPGDRKCITCGREINNPKFCSIQCQQDYYYKKKVDQWLNGKIGGRTKGGGYAGFVRKYLFEKYNNKCSNCGWSKINPYTKSKFPALEVEHINGNAFDNHPNNVTLLCPNCQSLTSTYKGANKGNGRREYMKKYYIKNKNGKIIRGN